MKITMTRTWHGLAPLDPGALRHVKQGDVVTCEVVKPRSGPRHRWFWACISLVHQNLSESLALKYPTPESLVAAMKVLTGWADTFWLPDGREVIRPRSIAFHAMDELKVRTGHAELRYTISGDRLVIPKSIAFHALDEDGFKAFCDRALALIAKDYLPGVNPDDLRREIDAQASERRAA